MKRIKLLMTILSIIIAISLIFANTKVFGTDADGINAISETGEETPVSNEEVPDQESDYDEGGDETNTEVENNELAGDETNADSSTEHSHELDTTPEIYNDDLYVLYGDSASDEYVMDKYVDGSVYIIGGNVKITGMIYGNLFILAQNVEFDENAVVQMETYVVADKITFAGAVYDMYAACNTFDMTDTGYVNRDLRLVADTANLKGMVVRNVNLVAPNIDVYDEPATDNEENSEENITDTNDVDINAVDTTNNTGLICYGNFNYTSGKQVEDIDKAQIKGEVNYTEDKQKDISGLSVMDYVIDGIENTIFIVVLYVALIFLAPKFVDKAREYVGTRTLLAFAIGAAFTILVPIIAICLFLSSVGAGLGMLLVMLYFTIFIISFAIATIIVNEFVVTKIPNVNSYWKKVLIIIPVSIVLFILRQIPYVGTIVSMIMFLVGIGAIILYQFDKKSKKETVKEEV